MSGRACRFLQELGELVGAPPCSESGENGNKQFLLFISGQCHSLEPQLGGESLVILVESTGMRRGEALLGFERRPVVLLERRSGTRPTSGGGP